MKFYAREMKNIKYGQTEKMYNKWDDNYKVWMKFGITHHDDDADKRFDKNVDDGYEKNYDDWDGKTEFSWFKLIGKQDGPRDRKKEAKLTKEQVEILEQHILTTVFPNPGPTLPIAEAAPEIAVIKSSPNPPNKQAITAKDMIYKKKNPMTDSATFSGIGFWL